MPRASPTLTLLIVFVGVRFDGQELTLLSDCARETTLAWTWLPDDAGVSLCPQACLAYESAALPLLEIGCPPD